MTMPPLNYFGAQHETTDPLKHDKTLGPKMLVHCPHYLLSLTQKKYAAPFKCTKEHQNL